MIIASSYEFNGLIESFHYQLVEKFKNIQQVVLQNVKLRRLPKKSFQNCSSLINIDLSNNYLSAIYDKLFSTCRILKYLDLSYNMIFEIGDDTFFGLENLEELDISYNRVTFSQQAIQNLTKLKKLFVQHYWLKNDDLTVFHHLKNLEVIDLSNFHSSFLLIEKLIEGLINLKEISLTFNYHYSVNFEFFSQFNLRILNLDSNTLVYIPEYAFKNLTSLTILGVSFNYLQTLSENTFYGLGNLEQLYLSYNSIDKIHENAFDHLKKLFFINLNLNRIEALSPRMFINLGDLKYLLISGNSISYFVDYTFTNLAKLTILMFDENRIRSLNSRAFSRHENLTYIAADSNMIIEIEENFFDSFPNLMSFSGFDNLCFNGYIDNFTALNKSEYFHECFNNWEHSVASPMPPADGMPFEPTTTTETSKISRLNISLILLISAFCVYLLM